MPLHTDPAREGVCAARSINAPVAETTTLSFSAQSIMQGAPETLNMMGGLTSAVWSKDLPTWSLDTEISGITCRKAKKIIMSCTGMSCFIVYDAGSVEPRLQHKSQGKNRKKRSYSRWLESCVYRNIWNVFGFHAAQNIPNNAICRKNIGHVSRWH